MTRFAIGLDYILKCPHHLGVLTLAEPSLKMFVDVGGFLRTTLQNNLDWSKTLLRHTIFLPDVND